MAFTHGCVLYIDELHTHNLHGNMCEFNSAEKTLMAPRVCHLPNI
jgi:hypothetical protein